MKCELRFNCRNGKNLFSFFVQATDQNERNLLKEFLASDRDNSTKLIVGASTYKSDICGVTDITIEHRDVSRKYLLSQKKYYTKKPLMSRAKCLYRKISDAWFDFKLGY